MIYRIDTRIVKLNHTDTDVPHIKKVIGKEEKRKEKKEFYRFFFKMDSN